MPRPDYVAEWDSEISDPPLLSRPSLAVMILRMGGEEGATVARAVERARRLLERVGEAERTEGADVEGRIRRTLLHLRKAALVDVADDGFRTTDRGQEVLTAHPHGVDGSVLSEFAEYREFIAERSAQGLAKSAGLAPPEPAREYYEGYIAHHSGQQEFENPYDSDTIRHLEWQNGWSEGRDERQHNEDAGWPGRPQSPA